MAEISAPRVEVISDPGPGSQDQPDRKTRAKPVAKEKTVPPEATEIGADDEEQKRQLDEMA